MSKYQLHRVELTVCAEEYRKFRFPQNSTFSLLTLLNDVLEERQINATHAERVFVGRMMERRVFSILNFQSLMKNDCLDQIITLWIIGRSKEHFKPLYKG